jgi:hypothetical protein
MAKSAWVKGGGNPSETLFEYPSQRKAKGKRLLD